MKKRWTALVLVLLLLVSAVSLSAQAAEEQWLWPIPLSAHNSTVLSRGWWKGQGSDYHSGIDITVKTGTQVMAVKSGKVWQTYTGCKNADGASNGSCVSRGLCDTNSTAYKARSSNGYCGQTYGNAVFIMHDDGKISIYCHLSAVYVNTGDAVTQGQVIGLSGNYGYAAGQHLHLTVTTKTSSWSANSINVNPLNSGFSIGRQDKTDMETAFITYATMDTPSGAIQSGASVAPSLSISGQTVPSGDLSLGANFGIRGVISTSCGVLTEVRGEIISASSGAVVQSGAYYPNEASHNLRYSVNNDLIFNNLPVDTYIYRVTATAQGGGESVTSTLIDTTFTVGGGAPILAQRPTVSIAEQTVPSTLALGANFGIRGVISTDCGVLTEVRGEIISASSGAVVQSGVYYPNEASHNLRYSVNNDLIFNNLPVDTYIYRVTATASNRGEIDTATLIDSAFTIGDGGPVPAPTPSQTPTPTPTPAPTPTPTPAPTPTSTPTPTPAPMPSPEPGPMPETTINTGGVRPTSGGGWAYYSAQNVDVDGARVVFQMYALKDADGNETNYVKVRDVAQVINGTLAQFNVDYDGDVVLTSRTTYVSNGSEMRTPFTGGRAYTVPTGITKIDGVVTHMDSIQLTDDGGGGYTYYKLRDLGKALGFNVGWTAGKGIFVETDKPYNANN